MGSHRFTRGCRCPLRPAGFVPISIRENAHHFVNACQIKSRLLHLKDLLLADLHRAHTLVTKVHPDPIDPQFRIATPEGDYWIAITLTENGKERTRRLALVSDFMAYKLSFGFTLASEMHEPASVLAVGVIRDEFDAVISLIDRTPKLGTAPVFSPPHRVLRENVDPTILALRPRGSRTITSAREKELLQWFGPQGKFPAVALDRDGKIPR